MTPLFAALLGVLTWSLLEYLIHRFAGHHKKLVGARLNAFGGEHARHHREGGYFAPSWKKALTAVVVTALLAGPAILLATPVDGAAFIIGFVGFYVVYEWLHRRLHTHATTNAYGRWARRHHFIHHFHDPKANHGVTSPVWDWVFGTLRRDDVVRVPAPLAMRWLLDARGEVSERFRGEYALRGR